VALKRPGKKKNAAKKFEGVRIEKSRPARKVGKEGQLIGEKMIDPNCAVASLGWVCENHPKKDWDENLGCQCGAGMRSRDVTAI
jgi:hypothetical protein